MDPYIEVSNLWGDFHNSLIAAIKGVINDALPPGFVARTSERSYIALVESDEKKEHWFIPDIKIAAPRGRKGNSSAAAGDSATSATAESEPVELRAFLEEDFEEKFIDIYELQPERRLVTSIEVLSPSNKRCGSEGWIQYQRKRQALLHGQANLVELDLLRRGDRMPMLDPWPKSQYTLLMARAERAPRCRVWPTFFDRPMAILPIPLTKPHPDIPLALQPLVEAIYERGRYAQDIDYSKPLDPPLSPEQATWLAEQLHRANAPTEAPAPQKRRKRNH